MEEELKEEGARPEPVAPRAEAEVFRMVTSRDREKERPDASTFLGEEIQKVIQTKEFEYDYLD